MAANTKKSNKKPQKEPVRIPWALIGAIAFGGLAILAIYVIIFAPTEGMLSQLRSVLAGLGGNLYVLFPVVLIWLCVMSALAAAGKKVSVWRIIANLLMIICFYSVVELFVLGNVERTNTVILSWADFVVKAFRYAKGGGAIGALAAAALYPALGKWGGLIVMLVVVTILMAITGKITKIVSVIRESSHEAQQRRLVRENDNMFDTTMLDDNVERRAPAGRAGANSRGGRPIPQTAGGPQGRMPRRKLYNEKIDAGAQGNGAMGAARTPGAVRAGADRANAPAYDEKAAGETANAGANAAEVKRPVNGALAGKTSRMEFDPVDIPDTADGIMFEIQDDEFPDETAAPAAGAAVPAADDAGEGAEVRERTSNSRTRRSAGGEKTVHSREKKAAEREKKADEREHETEMREQISIDDLRIEPDEYETEDNDSQGHDSDEGDRFVPMPRLRRDVNTEEEEVEYNYPPLDLIKPGSTVDSSADRNSDLAKAKLLEETLQSFGINTKLTGIAHGPAVTRFELQPAPGVRVSRISALADDIALNLAAIRVRIEAPIPGKAAVGVEIPNDKVETVSLRDVLESSDATQHKSRIAVGLGKDNSGRYIVADIAKMPHVLIAGQTGSGKSVCINSLIVSILYRATPEEVKLILIDPKVVELSVYNGIPHLIAPVVTDAKKAASALEWAVMEMNSRYKKFSERNVRNIKGYNSALKPGEEKMPQIVIIIDELADLMMVAPGEVEDSICRLAQLARAAGMHLVIATQRPSVNVITGIIKANIPSRIAFLVASQVDSRTIIDHSGAEKLLGNGDMLFAPAGIQKPMRVQGAWVSDEEVNNIVNYVKERHEAEYDEDVLEHINNAVLSDAEKEEVSEEYDPRLPEAIEIVMEAGQASISMLQRRMRVGYARAGRLVDDMYARGIISEADGAKPRAVLITREQYERMFEDDGE